jgi:DNA polymerase delta subunit 1
VQFDWKYVHGRTLICVDDATGDAMVDLSKLGRMLVGGGVVTERELNSGAFGQNKFFTLTTPGVLQLDLLQVMRRDHKLDSYSLNNVSKKFLGDQKVDLPAWQIFEKFDGSSQDRALIAEYAAKDTLLPMQLLSKLCIFENIAEMASATFVPMDYVLQRGQQIKVWSVLTKKARAMGFVCPDNMGIGVVGKFTGATVLEAKKGAYFDIVSGLDFCSLYPSIIRAWNLCYSTIVLDPKYANVEGIEYYDVVTDQGDFKFARNVPSVLPALLADLASYRKAAKKKMAEAKARADTFATAIHNGAQLAFKITMNR